jgi:hypothetical protein
LCLICCVLSIELYIIYKTVGDSSDGGGDCVCMCL